MVASLRRAPHLRVVSDRSAGALSEAALAEALLRREPWAAETLWRRHAPSVFGFLARVIGQGADAEELTQQVFFRVLTRIRTLDDPSALRSFVYALAVGVLRRELRRRQLRRLWPGKRRELVDDGSSRRLDRESSSVLNRLYEVLDTLGPMDRILFVLRQIEGFSYGEMAEVLGRSALALRRRTQRICERVEVLVRADPLLDHYVLHEGSFETERQEGA